MARQYKSPTRTEVHAKRDVMDARTHALTPEVRKGYADVYAAIRSYQEEFRRFPQAHEVVSMMKDQGLSSPTIEHAQQVMIAYTNKQITEGRDSK